jgi:hypothetical protein
MAEIALYYPYVHPRNESWVKQALLFWPKIQRIVPENYPITDSPLLKRLVNEKILVERRPDPGADQLSGPFVEYVARYGASLRANYGVQRALRLPPQPGWNDSQLDPRLGWIHSGKVDPGAVKALLKSKLATLHRREPTWIGVHPALFHVYMCFLAAQLSQRTSTMTEPVTDAPLHHVGAFGWSIEAIARALLTELPHPQVVRSRSDDQPDPQALLVAVAVRALVPRDLERVPIERILEMRQDHDAEFARYRQSMRDLSAQVATIDGAGDARTLGEYIEVCYQQTVGPELEALRNTLRASRVKTAFTAMSFQIAAPSTLVGGGLTAVASPVVGAGVATAIAVGAAAHEVAEQRASARAGSSAAWLVRVEGLAPRTLRSKVAAALRRFLA